jgi:hypothetical protein
MIEQCSGEGIMNIRILTICLGFILLIGLVFLGGVSGSSQPPGFWEEERAYQAALQYIEQQRKSDVLIKVVDQAGTPVKDASISYQQTTHDFAFGFTGNPGWATPSDEAQGWKLFEFTQGQYIVARPGKAQLASGESCRSGSCLHVKVNRDQNLGINSDDVSVESHASYEVTFWIKVVRAPASETGPTFGIYWGKGAVGSAWQGVDLSLVTPKLTVGDYTPVALKVTAPRAATRAIIGVRVNMEGARPGDVEFYLDDVIFIRSGSTQNLLPNPGFEQTEAEAWALWTKLCQSTGWIRLYWQLWATIEPQRGVFHWEVPDFWFQRILDRCPGARFVIDFGELAYKGVPRPDVTPAWTNADKLKDPAIFEQFKQYMYEYVYQVVKHYSDKVRWWGTLNELIAPEALSLLGTVEKAIELDRVVLKAIRDADPGAKALLATTQPGYVAQGIDIYGFVQRALASGLQVDGITIEGFPTEEFTPVWYHNFVQRLASLGKPVFIQETGYPSPRCHTSYCFPAWGGVYDEVTQAAWVKYMTAIPYGTENVMGVLWVFAVDAPLYPDWPFSYMGLFTREGRTKQAYDVYRQHIQMFTTVGSGNTNGQGQLAFRGFAGEYTVIVTAPDGRKVEQTIHVREKAENNFTIVLR